MTNTRSVSNKHCLTKLVRFVLLAFSMCLQSTSYSKPLSYNGLLLEPHKTIKAYPMVNQDGKNISFPVNNGKLQLIFFGYTSCPDVCPMTLHKIKHVIKQLNNRDDIEFYFVSIDTERDKPDLLKSFVNYYHPQIQGITGTIHNIKNIENEFGILTRKFQGKSSLAYQLEHSVFMYLMNRHGKLMLMYPGSSTPETIAQDLKLLLGRKKQATYSNI